MLKTLLGTVGDRDALIVDDELQDLKKAVFDAAAEDRPADRVFIPYHYRGSERYVRLDQITWFGRQYAEIAETRH